MNQSEEKGGREVGRERKGEGGRWGEERRGEGEECREEERERKRLTDRLCVYQTVCMHVCVCVYDKASPMVSHSMYMYIRFLPKLCYRTLGVTRLGCKRCMVE